MASNRRRRLSPQELARLCSYATTMGRCPNVKVTLTKDGGRFVSPFCKLHCCKKIENNAACQTLRSNSKGYCQQHLLCTGTTNGQRCTNYIKAYDPKDYKFCSQLHNCLEPTCAAERTRQNDTDLRYCPDHRCAQQNCASPRAPGGSTNCVAHTCASPACLASCPGATGDQTDPSRYCDRHRVCGTAACRQFAHLRVDGVPSRHCGAHFCRWEGGVGCDAERIPAADETCLAHTCVEAGCARARDHKVDGADFCKEHECTARDCRFRRWLGEFCPSHQCGRIGCEREGRHAHYCDRHRTCTIPGCERFRVVDGENVKEFCEEHSITHCRRPDCDAPVFDGTALCERHLCTHRPCTNERSPYGGGLCASHNCSVMGCPQERCYMIMPQADLSRWGIGIGIGGGSGQTWPLVPFCSGHACRHELCGEQAAGNSCYCPEHARCWYQGCPRVVDRHGEDPGLCVEHNRLGVGRRRGALNEDPFGYRYGWNGIGQWGVNAAI